MRPCAGPAGRRCSSLQSQGSSMVGQRLVLRSAGAVRSALRTSRRAAAAAPLRVRCDLEPDNISVLVRAVLEPISCR